MIGIIRSRTFDGSVIYQGQIQVDEHQGIPVFEGALCHSGFPKDDVAKAIAHAEAGLRRLGDRIPLFSMSNSGVAVHRSHPPGRIVYLPLVKMGSASVASTDDKGDTVFVPKDVPVFRYAAPGEFPETIDRAIEIAKEMNRG